MSQKSELYEKGKQVRMQVLGEEYVKKSLASRKSEFAEPIQDFTTEWCWGTVWARPDLDRRARSLINLAFMIAMRSWRELGIHTKGAIRNGLTEVEIREVVMQSMIYCGVPAGVEALKVCETSINEMVEAGEHKRVLKAAQ